METQVQVLSEDEKAQVHERTLSVLERGRHALRHARGPPHPGRGRRPRSTRRRASCGSRPTSSSARWRGRHALHAAAAAAPAGASPERGPALHAAGRRRRHERLRRRDAGERRPATHDDWLAATRLLDALDDVGLYWCPTDYSPDYEQPAGFVRYFTEVFATFGKHVQDSFGTPELAPWLKEVLDIVFGGRERGARAAAAVVSHHAHLAADHRARLHPDVACPARLRAAVAIMPMPLQGATAPGSRLGHAPHRQLRDHRHALPRAGGGAGHARDLRAGGRHHGPAQRPVRRRRGRARACICAAGTEMARYYGLPAESSGFCTQTYEPDLQTAWEKANGGLLVTLSDPDILVGPGLLGGATTLCLEQIVLDVEESRLARQARSRRAGARRPLARRGARGGRARAARSWASAPRAPTRAPGEWRLSDFGVHGSRDAWRAAGSPTTLDSATRGSRSSSPGSARCRYSDDEAAALAALQRAPTPRPAAGLRSSLDPFGVRPPRRRPRSLPFAAVAACLRFGRPSESACSSDGGIRIFIHLCPRSRIPITPRIRDYRRFELTSRSIVCALWGPARPLRAAGSA